MRARLAFAAAAVTLLAGLTYATTARVSAQPEAVTVTYCRGLAMDLYPPATSGGPPAPVVLYVHGGAWRSGSRRDTGDHWPELLPRLREAGVFGAAIDYRLSAEAPWPAPLEDLRCALGYLRANGGRLHIDPERMRLYGTSAGGQVVAMAALEHLPGIERVADLYGPADLTAAGWRPWLRADIRAEFGRGLAAASPALQAAGPAPPFLVVQGDCDGIVPVQQSRELAARLRAAGVRVTYLEVHDAGHALGNCGGAPTKPSVAQVDAAVGAFLTG